MFRHNHDFSKVAVVELPPGVAAETVMPDGTIRQIMDDDFDRFVDEELPELMEFVEFV